MTYATADEDAAPTVCSIPDAQIKISEFLVKELLKKLLSIQTTVQFQGKPAMSSQKI